MILLLIMVILLIIQDANEKKDGKFNNDLTFDMKFIDIIEEYHTRKPIKKNLFSDNSDLDYIFECSYRYLLQHLKI